MYCPIFRLGELIRWSGYDFQDMAAKVIELIIRVPPTDEYQQEHCLLSLKQEQQLLSVGGSSEASYCSL